MQFASPYAFLLLLVIPAMLWLRRRGRGGAAIRFSSTAHAAKAVRSLRQRLSFIPLALRILAVVLLTLAVARPQKGLERVRDVNQGIAIEMVVDRSYSMAAEMPYEGQRMNRLDVVKRVFEDFVLGGKGDLEGRPNDLVGMITFARFADTVCPLTLAHGALPRFLETVQLVPPRSEENATAIGDALALAAARLRTAEDVLKRQAPDREDGYEIKSKVIILLTDGESNAGKRTPVQAAKLAADWGIKIYSIGVGGSESVVGQNTLFGTFLQMGRGQGVDTATLKAIAEETSGRFFMAEDAESLKSIYREIDTLERSEIESIRYMDYQELFLPFALAALLVLAGEVALTCTLFRRIP